MREPKVNVMVPTQKVTGVQTPFVHSGGAILDTMVRRGLWGKRPWNRDLGNEKEPGMQRTRGREGRKGDAGGKGL